MNRGDAACWAFGPPGAEIVVRNAELLLAHLPVFIAGWPFRRVPDGEGRGAAIDVAERAGGEIAVAADGETVFANAFDAANGLADALVSAFVRKSGLAAFNAAAVQVGRGLVVLLGEPGTGKTSIALQLAAAGHRLFGADRLALRLAPHGPPTALCLGLTPKVALPLPPDCGARLREYVEAFTDLRDADAAWLKLWEGEAAGFSETAPLAAIAVLGRQESGLCRLDAAAAAQVADALAAGCWSPPPDHGALAGLAARVPGYRMTFSNSRDAAAVLLGALRGRAPGGTASTGERVSNRPATPC